MTIVFLCEKQACLMSKQTRGAYHFSKEPVGMTMNNGKGFSKITKPTERDGVYHLKFGFLLLFSLDGRPEFGNRSNVHVKELSDTLF